ncbi:methyltransferase, FkbM family [Catalinimonas alkaloidigena]|uniref:Methyltransferase, FkbM family n=1 Tax=Catalinimonas alkaloidigena TaxID=1075417 RepID=A0A1G8ZM53_9BACT|nr:FkbM family methyltransferase [Catalinimonas alkaloidigena]SDK15230.1 methyltransferase, FkbM family [Catalinimonas alkaloidigena]
MMKLLLEQLFREQYHLLRTAESREFLRLLARYGDAPRYQTKLVRFLNYQAVVPDSLSFVWQFKEIFADQSYRFRTSVARPVIVDCGANIGMSCLYFKQLYPQAQITAFEADPTIASVLVQNLTLNHITDVQVQHKAVWVHNQGIHISQEGADAASVHGTGNRIEVPSQRLRDTLEAYDHIDMLKMDIEGAETEVLCDCRQQLGGVQHMFVEYHAYLGQPQNLSELLAVMTEAGFRYFIRHVQDRTTPFLNHQFRNGSVMDLQLNIFAYRTES